mgnify:CR=1 FL=1
MKKEYIIGGCIGLVFIIAIIACIVINKNKKQETPFTPTVSKIISIDENGNVNEDENKVKLENENKTKINEFAEQIKSSAENERYSMIILSDYIVHIDNNISLKFKSNIKEYVEFIDKTKEGQERSIVTKAPDGFVDWVMEVINE